MIHVQAGLKKGSCLTEINNEFEFENKRFNHHVLLNITFKFNYDIILIYFLFDSMYGTIPTTWDSYVGLSRVFLQGRHLNMKSSADFEAAQGVSTIGQRPGTGFAV